MHLIIAPLYIIWEGQTMSMIMELILYIICGILHLSHLIVIALNKQSIVTTYSFIQTNFFNWSVKRGMDPNGAYKKNIKKIKYFVTFWSFMGCTIILIFFNVNNLYTYGFIYLLQTILAVFLITATGAMKCGFIVLLSELNYQFEHLLHGLEHAFNHRMEQKFKIIFFDCVRHHQLIIKFFYTLI
ncbi:odorant receptor 49b-like [Aphis craccivora]|uniref:Odorant receptor 49b-like n=1 Tax=Aphis craccivora TaxID=307492 RepID=A0A6G0YWX5_APHCR|nr:odorant receptor 49b-like [Aphis craccivora]